MLSNKGRANDLAPDTKPEDVRSSKALPLIASRASSLKKPILSLTRVALICVQRDWIAHSEEFMEDGEEVGILVDAQDLILTDKKE